MINQKAYKKERRITVVRISNLRTIPSIEADHLIVIEDDSGNFYKVTVGDLLSNIGDSATSIIECNSFSEFPTIGLENKIYRDVSSNKSYVWNENGLKYDLFSSNYEDIKIINGKPTN
ncbi:MAG: hypothetical protein CVU04_03995 [Bacteroidetes bacterium HGW-Bacteroidetes-20]|nr:MAG: hypothetical protein CVU04_03995 [Bacteroidetes bacterium HGW-Bacteroidetes-20]